MAPVSATRSMGTRLGKLKSAVADLENILNEFKLKPSILEVEASYVQRLEQAVVKRFGSIDDKWEELEDEDNFADEAEREKCQKDYDDAKKIHNSILDASRQVLSQPRTTTPNVAQSTTHTHLQSYPGLEKCPRNGTKISFFLSYSSFQMSPKTKKS